MLTNLLVDLLDHFHEFVDEADRRSREKPQNPNAPDYFVGMRDGMSAAILQLSVLITSNPDNQMALLFALHNILPSWHLRATEEYEETIQAAARELATGTCSEEDNPHYALGIMSAYDQAHKSLSKMLDFFGKS
jgi:hypothetical protein